MSGPLKRSGLQNEVINFYRQCFRAARDKPLVSARIFSISDLHIKSVNSKLDLVFMHLSARNLRNTILKNPISPQLNTCWEKEENSSIHIAKRVLKMSTSKSCPSHCICTHLFSIKKVRDIYCLVFLYRLCLDSSLDNRFRVLWIGLFFFFITIGNGGCFGTEIQFL